MFQILHNGKIYIYRKKWEWLRAQGLQNLREGASGGQMGRGWGGMEGTRSKGQELPSPPLPSLRLGRLPVLVSCTRQQVLTWEKEAVAG